MNDKFTVLTQKPGIWDISILSLFLFWITFQPNLFVHEIIYLDQGLYLPAIDAIFKGQVPFRDFVLYRGPLEVYIPAAMMKLFGNNMIWLPVFFAVGTVVNMWLAVMIAYRLLRTRFMLYLFVPVLIARTYPRISFYYWGGLRYALGLWALYLTVRFLQTKKTSRLIWAGGAAALGFLTTIESGVTASAAVGSGLIAAVVLKWIDGHLFKKGIGAFITGFLAIALPYGIFLVATNSLWPYIESTFIIPLKMTSAFLIIDTHVPSGFWHFMASLAPTSKYFKLLTPVYCYGFLTGFIIYRIRKGERDWATTALITIGIYALILYIASFRAIWGHHFEMALQPQKIIYFFMVESGFLYLVSILKPKLSNLYSGNLRGWSLVKHRVIILFIGFLICGLIGSSLGYSLTRYSRHFPVYKNLLDRIKGNEPRDYSFLKDQDYRAINVAKAKGMMVPAWQADDIEAVVRYIEANTKKEEAVLTYPEIGSLNYLFDRPFVGRFPIATLSWARDEWHEEHINDIRQISPRYAIMTNSRHKSFGWSLYFRFQGNIDKYNEVTDYVLKNYTPVLELSSVTIYRKREL